MFSAWAPEQGFDPLGTDIVLRSRHRHLPGLGGREARLEVAQASVDVCVTPFAFDHQDRRATFDDDEVDLAAVNVTEVTQFDVPAERVLLEVHPLQQVTCHQILEPGRFGRYDGPVDVVVLLLLLDRANPRCAERRQAKEGVEALESRDPGRGGPMADLEVLAQSVDRQRRADEVRQPEHQEFELSQVLDALQGHNVFADKTEPA